MKIFLFLSLFISGTAFSQTNVIAAKSHASAQVVDNNDLDNFGDPMEQRTIETVKYLNNDCIVEIYTSYWNEQGKEYDTICDHPFLQPGQTDIERIKSMYPSKTEFIGFQAVKRLSKKAQRKLKREDKKREKSSGLIIFLIGGTLLFVYLFIPKMNPSKS